MKKPQLTIKKLRIESFVTLTDKSFTLKGGAFTDYKQCGTGPATINSCPQTNFYECGTVAC